MTKIFLGKFFVCLIKEENKFRTLTLEEKGIFIFFFLGGRDGIMMLLP